MQYLIFEQISTFSHEFVIVCRIKHLDTYLCSRYGLHRWAVQFFSGVILLPRLCFISRLKRLSLIEATLDTTFIFCEFFWRFFDVFLKYGLKWFYMFPIVVMSGLTRFCMVWHGSMWFCVVLRCCVWLGVVGHGCT